uniref:Uncharacterized protein n=1 Tax=Amphimedon queenslandica TaxID=400682 RepID=A0A1X7V9P7_AMPQE
MKQLVLWQYLWALSILRTNGHFVCKVCGMQKSQGRQAIGQSIFIFINETIHDLRRDEEEEKVILEVVPDNLLQTKPFYTYSIDSNNSFYFAIFP